MTDTIRNEVLADRADAYSQYHAAHDEALEREKSARFWVQRARADAEAATLQAKMAARYLTEGYSQRRRHLAQAAEDAAQLAIQNARRAEEVFLVGDYNATIRVDRASRNLVSLAHESARLATIDERELGRCPHCMARLRLLILLPDAPNHQSTHFNCESCGLLWRTVSTSDGVILERVTE